MSDAAGELADRLHLLCLAKLRLHAAHLGEIDGRQQDVLDVSTVARQWHQERATGYLADRKPRGVFVFDNLTGLDYAAILRDGEFRLLGRKYLVQRPADYEFAAVAGMARP